MLKTDLLTGESFVPKRNNQKFASSKNRIKYNNNKANALRKSKSFVNKPLDINFKILQELMEENKEEVFHKQFLLGKGFNFFVHTHYENYKGKNFIAIYNFIMIPIENDNIRILRK